MIGRKIYGISFRGAALISLRHHYAGAYGTYIFCGRSD